MKITPRQAEIVEEVLLGKSNQEIGRSLAISTHTVKVHLTRIYKAFAVSSRAKLTRKLMQKRLL
jgi:DNA-binding NarL/FixJ family response regulator